MIHVLSLCFCLSVCLSVWLSASLPVCVIACFCVCLPVCLPICDDDDDDDNDDDYDVCCVGETMNMESVWSLALVVKSVVMVTADGEGSSSILMLLHHQQFVECISYLALLGTGLSRNWVVEDLEVTLHHIVLSSFFLHCRQRSTALRSCYCPVR